MAPDPLVASQSHPNVAASFGLNRPPYKHQLMNVLPVVGRLSAFSLPQPPVTTAVRTVMSRGVFRPPYSGTPLRARQTTARQRRHLPRTKLRLHDPVQGLELPVQGCQCCHISGTTAINISTTQAHISSRSSCSSHLLPSKAACTHMPCTCRRPAPSVGRASSPYRVLLCATTAGKQAATQSGKPPAGATGAPPTTSVLGSLCWQGCLYASGVG